MDIPDRQKTSSQIPNDTYGSLVVRCLYQTEREKVTIMENKEGERTTEIDS